MATLGVLDILISVNDSQVKSGINSAEGKMKSFGNRMSSWAVAKGQVLGRLIERAGASTIKFVKGSVEESKAFDKSMAQVAATLGKTTNEIKELSNFARKMGAETAFTAQEAAEGLNYMALAGYDAEKSMKMLPQVLNLAAAGNFELARASDMVTDAQSALGLTIPGTERLIDQMAMAASKSNTSVEQLGDAILTVGGTAKMMGKDTEMLTASLGILADNGIKGAEGGTALRNILLALSAPTSSASKQLKKLGVQVFDSEGNMRSLQDVMLDLGSAMEGMTDKQRTSIINDIFNKRDLKSVEALLGTTYDRWEELLTSLDGSKGSAAKMAETQLDNLAGDTTKFKSALGEAKLALVEGLTPSLRKYTQIGTKFVQRLTNAFKKKGLKGAIEEAGTIFSKFVENLKASDSPGLQKLGGALEGVKNVAKEVFELITDFPGKLKEWQESDSPGLQTLASLFGSLSDAVTVVEAAFNGGLPAAIDKLKEINSPISNIAATGLEALKSFCEFVVGHSDIGGIIETLALGFAAFKGIEISASLITFLSKLSSIKNASQLNQLLKGLNGGGGGDSSTPTTVPTPTTTPTTTGKTGGSWISKIKAGAKAAGAKIGSTWATAGGMWSLSPLAVLGLGLAPAEIAMAQTRQKWSEDYNRRMNAAQLPSDNAQFISEAAVALGTNGQVDWDKAENLLMGLSKRQNKQKAELYNLLKDSTTAGDKTWNLLNKFWEGAELDPNQINEMLQDITDAFAKETVSMPVDPEVDIGSAQSQLNGAGFTAPVTPIFNGSNIFGNKKAKGDWNVPSDNYPALLHRGEMVLNQSQARRYRDGDTGTSAGQIAHTVGRAVKEAMKEVKVMMSGEKVGDLTTKRVRNNINAKSYSRVRGFGGA